MDGRASGVVVALPADDLGHDEYFYLDWLAQPELESMLEHSDYLKGQAGALKAACRTRLEKM